MRRPETREIERVARKIRGLLAATARAPRDVVPTGWAIDERLAAGGLATGAVHEWFASEGPLSILIHLGWRALETAERTRPGARVLWIGRRVWPYPRALVGDFAVRSCSARSEPASSEERAADEAILELARLDAGERPADERLLLARSVLVDVREPGARLWSIDAALRCPSVAAVVADGSGLDMRATRRLQLAAEAGRGLGLLARPARERDRLSAAATRWWVEVAQPVEGAARPRWIARLARQKRTLDPTAPALHGPACVASSP